MCLCSSPSCLVFLVEDDDCIRATFADVLESEGYEVLSFSNGPEALERLRSDRKPCLILLDWMMPGMSGEQFLSARTNVADESPVVVVSATAPRASRAPGVAALVPKPVDMHHFLEVVRRHCGPRTAIA